MKGTLLSLLAIAILFLPGPALAQEELTANRIIEDIDYMVDKIKLIHPRPWQMISEADFMAEVTAVKAAVPERTQQQNLLQMTRLLSLLEDGHSRMLPVPHSRDVLQVFPLRTHYFADGWYILALPQEHAECAGGRITHVGELTAEQAWNTIEAIAFGDNRYDKWEEVPYLALFKAVLEPLELLNDEGKLQLTVECTDGKMRELAVAAVDHNRRENSIGSRLFGLPEGVERATAMEIDADLLPLSMQRLSEPYWYTYLEDHDVLYMQFNSVREKEDEPLAQFAERMFAEYDERTPQRLVIDLRYNGGGNNQLLKPLLHGLIKREEFQQQGNLVYLIGRHTFSAAMSFCGWSSRHVNVTFAGEPSGARPNHPGDVVRLLLPNSGLQLRVSNYYWTGNVPWDYRDAVYPAVGHMQTSDEFFAYEDRLLQRVLEMKEVPSLGTALRAAQAEGGAAAIPDAFAAYRQENPELWGNYIPQLFDLAREIGMAGDLETGMALLQLMVETYPEESLAWQRLSEAYAYIEQYEQALQAMQRALSLDPKNRVLQIRLLELRSIVDSQ